MEPLLCTDVSRFSAQAINYNGFLNVETILYADVSTFSGQAINCNGFLNVETSLYKNVSVRTIASLKLVNVKYFRSERIKLCRSSHVVSSVTRYLINVK